MFGIWIQYEADRPEGGAIFLACRKTKEDAEKRAAELAARKCEEAASYLTLSVDWVEPTEENYLMTRAIIISEAPRPMMIENSDGTLTQGETWSPTFATIYVDAIEDHD